MTSRRQPSAAFWATVVVAVVALYVASFGPACWIAARTEFGASRVFELAYWPVGRAVYAGVPVVDTMLVDYAELGMPPGTSLVIPGRLEDEGGELWLAR